MKSIDVLIDGGGSIALQALHPNTCVTTAADTSNILAMFFWRNGGTLDALFKHLDYANCLGHDESDLIDELN